MAFRLTEKQEEANRLLAGPARHILLRGGSRSGKTFLLLRAMAIRAMRAPDSRHAVFRFRFNHIKMSVIFDTFPKMMALCFPHVPIDWNRTDWFVDFPNKSRILFGGLDEKERTEKVLGQEFATVFLNECSQIAYEARNKVITRLSQKSGLSLKAYYDTNPPGTAHWLYRMFERRIEPKSGESLPDPEVYATMLMNPTDNLENLSESYIKELAKLPSRDRMRFLEGQWLPQVENALWTLDTIEQNRCTAGQLPDMKRIVVAVDPSGCHGEEDERSDEIGIVVCGMGVDRIAYVLEDGSGRYSPDGWARQALNLFDRWQADRIVCEQNFGGAMVKHTIRTARREAPVTEITASRGKVQRAEPVSALYEQGMVKHVGIFPELEEQMCNFATNGYQGSTSPDRADSLVWALSELAVKSPVPLWTQTRPALPFSIYAR